jgi:shikimate kinase
MRDRKSNVYLMGFMGCGKTRIGSLLAKKLDRPFLDTDTLIIEECGMSINAIFQSEGEAGFREREKRVIERMAKLEKVVVALGGGAVVDAGNWKSIYESGTTIALSYPPEIIATRLERKKDRPLLNPFGGEERLQRIAALMEARSVFYRKADLFLHLNQEVEPERLAEALSGFLRVVI